MATLNEPGERRLSDVGKLYVAVVATAGIVAVAHSVLTLVRNPVGVQWFVLAGLTLLSGSFTVRIPTIPARLSVSETFVFAAAILFGPEAATTIVVLDTLVISLWRRRSWTRSASRVLFNMAAPSVAILVAAHVFFMMAGIPPLYHAPRPILSLVGPLLALAVLYFLLNSWLIAGAVAFEKRTSALGVWRENFFWLSLNYFSGASVAALLLPYLQQEQHAFFRIAGILLPLLLISYLTFKTALGRVEDANSHLSQLNKLYLSTIETLAMAIDAKDQITHGHIRRVQQYAVGLAKELGVTDRSLISAIEAASLLHDMGKLAVPEYILNKPGKLTPAEFEKMKLHASVGADILSAIAFPYPVVPIVRHHHENWDGSGYPDGLKGSEIPIGARILSVVDCFDALTSDRPYRPRLADSDALRILQDRRGTMYDPLVVDTFSKVHAGIAPPATLAADASTGLSAITRGVLAGVEADTSGSRLEDIAASTEEMLALYDLAQGLTGHFTLSDAADVISKHLRRVVPASTSVFFLHDPEADELYVAHTAGEAGTHFAGLRIPRGQRLTGWVAANKQTVVNSDPVLDLGEVARAIKPRLRSCLSTPLIAHESLVGVLNLYSVHRDAFTEDHRRIIEAIARQVSQTVQRAVEFERERTVGLRDQLTGLPNLHHLERFISSELNAQGRSQLSIVLVEITGLKSSRLPAAAHDEVVAGIASAIRRALRGADLLFRYSELEFVVLLTQTEKAAAHALALRIRDRLLDADEQPQVRDNRVSVMLGVATAPSDGKTLNELVRMARERERLAEEHDDRPPSVH